MFKVMTIVGTRPEFIKMSRVIAELDRNFKHILVHSGQNYDYELNQVFFEDLEIRKPDHFLNAAGESAAATIAQVLLKADEVFEKEKPDALLLYGDTNTCLAVISAKRRKIPIFHMEAGNRCFDQRVPEELNRKVVDHLSDINLVLTEHARRYLLAEGIKPETIIKTGSHMDEVLKYYKVKIEKSDILEKLKLEKNKFFIVSFHREENVDTIENLKKLLESLNAICEEYGLPVIVSTHPRTRKRLEDFKEVEMNPLITFLKPFGFFDYVQLQMSAFCILSDSGTITEEASLLDLPAVTIRNTHERPEGMDFGTLIMSGFSKERILESVRIVVDQYRDGIRHYRVVDDYSAGQVSKKIVFIVQSYTDYINRTVWHKS
ncbi:non-hydrolyzing UDP-N-acetylglucosamine 2-epimerase [Leptospira borgpetersenii]|uniref:UDP-N-acetylglucosamine 2-epimerase domain-containing protein n=3 Tax=Leptospira borgpetersenii TaxID=174 RepID=Q9ZGL3_LEPBO|nr:UDP-N-acetylglucosamine 2-epimerase (non-hydrolyzing) [Leptospira borgpetersenii]AAD12956.1 unknown [Leptospira borgpetersenii]ABJ75775.1 UDP-N-acetylglucosamine 2-epimerase [Leptospira borgpetersenii serovar Hardjo-bovis str. JB197]ABJ78720.1 UDP-N-acetylglucosamine 2-epimerase [Leptospira borgpetersenii serovar Hardjo-bovis str. L550]AMX59080.1 UDP-N-acetylglucosamine 2-epimerase [Leptospira borgpetersenii serovar Hardjo]AMX61239.1 UDP-N-acetylglucosamine 2-epimerase [Leptospira borgpeter